MENTDHELPAARHLSRSSEEHIYISRMARSLVGSLGRDEATRCVNRYHWDGLRPLIMAEDPAICRSR